MSDLAGGAELQGSSEKSPSLDQQAGISGASAASSNVVSGGQPTAFDPVSASMSSNGARQAGSQAPSVLAALRAAGYNTDGFTNDQEVLSAINARLADAENYERQIQDYQRQLAALASQQAASIAPLAFERVREHLSAPIETRPGWNPPPYDTRNDEYFSYDPQTRRWVPNRPNIPYELVQAKNDYMDYRAAFAKEWTENPVDAIWKRTEDRNRALIREELSQLFNQMQVIKDTNDWLEKHKNVLFVDGQVDHSGNPEKLTVAGKLAMEAVDKLDEAGVQDPAARRMFVEKYVAAGLSEKWMQQQQQDPSQRVYPVSEIARAIQTMQQDPLRRLYSLPEIIQAITEVTGQVPGGGAGDVPPMAVGQTVPVGAPYPQAYPQVAPAYYPPQYMQPPFPQQAYPQQQMQVPMTPERVNAEHKRRFLGGVGHSSSAGAVSSPASEFVPRPSPNGRPDFLAIANQLAAAQGISL